MHRLAAHLAALALLAPAAALAQEQCRAIDGDTIRCGRERVRLIGVYTPEHNEPGYAEAKELLQRRIEAGAVTIERRGGDRYGRTLGHVRVDGVRVMQGDVGPVGGRGIKNR